MKTQTSLLTIFIFVVSLHWTTLAFSNECGPTQVDFTTQARIAQAGNIVVINNRQFQMAGVYAPEIGSPSNRTDPAKPLSRESLTFINRILANHNREVSVEFDESEVDGFGRPVAHLFLKDGRNLNKMLIEAGLGMGVTNPPNMRYQACYYKAEKKARDQQKGLWRLAAQSPELKFPIALSSQLNDMDNGFRIIRGPVRTVKRSRNNIIINLDTTGIRVQKDYWPYFDYAQLERLVGQTIEVRGYGFVHQGAVYVVIQHPNMIDVLNPHFK
jgi:endonuclease YncB( thermonuclease family)